MNINTVFPSKYLKASEFTGDVSYTIKEVTIEEVGSENDKERKPIVYFNETEKGLACNKTNANTIAGIYGPETSGWIGRRITLFATEVDFQGTQTLAIRVRMRPPTAPAAAQAPAPAPAPAATTPAPSGKLAAWGAFITKWNEYKIDNPDATDADRDAKWKALLAEALPGKDPKSLGTIHWDELALKITAEYSVDVGFVPF
jgi:hypothetical protein